MRKTFLWIVKNDQGAKLLTGYDIAIIELWNEGDKEGEKRQYLIDGEGVLWFPAVNMDKPVNAKPLGTLLAVKETDVSFGERQRVIDFCQFDGAKVMLINANHKK
jgi:hypothetical protein